MVNKNDTNIKMIQIESKSQLLELVSNNENVIVDFYADWCGPCKMLMPLLTKLSEEHKNVTFCKVNVDANAELSIDYKIQSIPHVFFIKNGEIVHEFKGIQSKPQIINSIKKHFPE